MWGWAVIGWRQVEEGVGARNRAPALRIICRRFNKLPAPVDLITRSAQDGWVWKGGKKCLILGTFMRN